VLSENCTWLMVSGSAKCARGKVKHKKLNSVKVETYNSLQQKRFEDLVQVEIDISDS